MNINNVIEKAKTSKFHLSLLNFGLNRMVPFNKPHGFKVTSIEAYKLQTMVPYRKANFNHIRGIHACALATLTEFTTGFLLLSSLDSKKYRLIMQRLQMDYHYQAKMNVTATFEISEEWLNTNVYKVLESTDKTAVDCELKTFDTEGNHIATGIVTWQIKSWDKVKTKV